jgi:hypothetical protein
MLFLLACVSEPTAEAAKGQPITGPADPTTDTGIDSTIDTGADTAPDTATPEDSASVEDTAADSEEEFVVTCDFPDIRPGDDDPDPAAVGDTWTLWLWCDGTLMLGVQRIQITPPEAGLLYDNEVEWVAPGEVQIRMQSGSYGTTETFVIGA